MFTNELRIKLHQLFILCFLHAGLIQEQIKWMISSYITSIENLNDTKRLNHHLTVSVLIIPLLGCSIKCCVPKLICVADTDLDNLVSSQLSDNFYVFIFFIIIMITVLSRLLLGSCIGTKCATLYHCMAKILCHTDQSRMSISMSPEMGAQPMKWEARSGNFELPSKHKFQRYNQQMQSRLPYEDTKRNPPSPFP